MTMIATPITEQIPIRRDEHGRLRVGNTRVLLDLVIYAYWRGDTPEGIVEQYPSLSLDDVYLALGYYLRHRADVDTYMREQKAEAERGERETPPELRPTLTREILLARLKVRQEKDEA